jgi:CO/xanthine dehydrogenase Mo-binding subunit
MLSAYGYFDGTIPANSSSSSGSNGGSLGGSNGGSSGSNGRQAVSYSAFGAAVSEVELDVLTGERRVLATDIAYDCGYALNPRIDLGQVEGAFVMGE